MRSILSGWEVDLTRWLKPFLDRLGHKARRRMCPLYVAGLIGPGDRKSVQPMAERLAPGDYDTDRMLALLREAIEGLGLSQIAAARLLGVDARTSRRWASGERDIPPPVARFLRYLIATKKTGEQAMRMLSD
jgi:hypothetical protein